MPWEPSICNLRASADCDFLATRAEFLEGGRSGAEPGIGKSRRLSLISLPAIECVMDPLRTLALVADRGDCADGGDEMDELSLLLFRLPDMGDVNGGIVDCQGVLVNWANDVY